MMAGAFVLASMVWAGPCWKGSEHTCKFTVEIGFESCDLIDTHPSPATVVHTSAGEAGYSSYMQQGMNCQYHCMSGVEGWYYPRYIVAGANCTGV